MGAERVKVITDLAQRLASLELLVRNLMMPGTVAEVDPAKSRVRMRIGGTDAQPMLGPWTPYAQVAGGTKAHIPPTVGQQMMLFSPCGDPAQGLAVPMTFTDQNASPGSKGDENAVSFGKTVITGAIEITGPVTITGDFRVSGGAFEHNGKDVGSTHKHTQVLSGGDVSGPPQ